MRPEDFADAARYRLLLRLPFDQAGRFVLHWMSRFSDPVCLLYYLILTLTLGLFAGHLFADRPDMNTWLPQSLLAIILSLVIILPHEALHALVYRLFGAKDIRFGVVLSQGVVFAAAHRFVINGSQLRILALTPFAVLNGSLLVLALFLPGWRTLLLVLALLHLIAVIGDWAMVVFVHQHRAAPLSTWDDVDQKTAWYYQEIQSSAA